MEIELKNVAYANNDIYQVGNVFSRSGTPFLVVKIEHEPVNVSYGFVDLEKAKMTTPCASLEILAKQYGFSGDTLVKAKLTVDYKLDGDE